MCGIAGILRVWPPERRAEALATPPAAAIPEAWLDVLDESVRHRGPDGHGRFRDRALRPDGCVVDVALVHRRLSIIDHAGGHQPMVLSLGTPALRAGRLLTPDELQAHNRRVILTASGLPGGRPPGADSRDSEGDHRIAVVFNGCIYNHRELRAELERAGHVFSTDHSDTEVLVHGWREWHEGLAKRVDGMFAVAIWDARTGTLMVGRDFAHEKPLHTAFGPDGCAVFASVPAAIVRWYALAQQAPTASSDDWYGQWIRFGASDDPSSCERHWPARAMLHDLAGWERRRGAMDFDELPERGSGPPLDAERVDGMLRAAVASRLEADVPIGCFLSGGVDSSLVAKYAQEALGPDERLTTLCVRMPDPRYDESAHAQRVADLLGTRHTTLEVQADPASDLQSLITQMGVPFGDSSLLPTHWVSRAVREHVKVALSGDGGDELFVGYDRHIAALRYRRMARLLAMLPVWAFPERDPKSTSARLRRLAAAGRSGYRELRAVFNLDDFEQLAPESTLLTYKRIPMREEDPAALDFYEYLGADVLAKSDAASMSVGLEVRAPLLANPVVGSCLRTSYADLMPHGQRKGLLRQVARRYLPADIIDRPKMGFAIPIGEWFRTDYGGLRTMLLDHLTSTEPFGPPSLGIDLNTAYVRQMLDEHLGTGPSGLVKRDHSQRLYMLLVLSIWAKWLGSLR